MRTGAVDWARRHAHVVLALCLGIAALGLRLEAITRPSVESRELHNALIARQLYLGDDASLPAWQQRVLDELGEVARPIEPPILDLVAAVGYRIAGAEELWIPRLASSALWIVGGLFLYLIALRLTTRAGALVALGLYLAWPYAVWLSRLYMPDGTMVALLLVAAHGVIRYWERPSTARFLVAGTLSSLAAVIKPGVAALFLVALFTALAVSNGLLRATLRNGRLPGFILLTAALPVAYYVFGTYVLDFLAGESGGRVDPSLLTTAWFWEGWWEMVSTVLVFPQGQSYLALLPLGAAAAGFVVARRGVPRATIAGLFLGYLAFGLLVPGFTATHAYYALPLIPTLSLAIGVLAGWLLARFPAMRFVVFSVVLFGLAGAVYKSHAVLTGEPPSQLIADYRRIGEITRHTPHAIVVDTRLRSPISYWGWMVARYWYPPTPAQDLPVSGNPFPSWIDPADKEFLVVVDVSELETEARLRSFTRTLPVVARTDRYAIFDLRGGRARDAAAG